MATLLEVKGLRVHFDTPDGVVRAVDGIGYTLDEGEILGLVGESGCGKTVSALALMRLVPRPPGRIVAGEILFEGCDLLKLPGDQMRAVRGAKIAMIFQDPAVSLNPVLPICRQISEVMELHLGLDQATARRRTIELLDRVGIPDPHRRVDDYPQQFSGGQRQRVMIALALACNPKLLIADEPTTALDVTVQAQILDLVRGLQREMRMAIIWITHDLGVVASLADRVIVMYAGRVAEQAGVDEIFDNPRHPYTIGLLRSVPRLDEARRRRLASIEGLPPDLAHPRRGCVFEPRCRYAVERCAREEPPLLPVDAVAHDSACWRWSELGQGAGVGGQ